MNLAYPCVGCGRVGHETQDKSLIQVNCCDLDYGVDGHTPSFIRACLIQPRIDRFAEPNEPVHEILYFYRIYEHRRRSLTSYG